LREIVRQFKALSDETRLRIIGLLFEGELCVCHLVEVLGLPQSNVSRHMAYLRNAGLVQDRREGVWIYYSLAEPANGIHACQLRCLADWFGQGGYEVLRRDRARLEMLRTRQPGASCTPRKESL